MITTTTKRYYSTEKEKFLESNSERLISFIKENNLKPVYCYENLYLESIKKKDTKRD